MKFDKNKAFPYPVLRPFSDDYNDVEFQVTVDFSVTKDKVPVNITFALSSDEIAEQVSSGAAEYVAIISCRDTYFQSVVSSKNREINTEFNVGDLRGEVKVDPYIVAIKNIESFTSPDINPEFGNGPFKFTVGDILAQDDAQGFYFDRDMFKPVTSVFQLVKKDNIDDGVWTVAFDEEYIQIGVNQNTKASIDEARNDTKKKYVLLNSIYFAAVMQAIQKLQFEKETYENKKWAEVILRQAHNKGYDLASHDSYYIAEQLMQLPLKRLSEFVFRGSE